MGSCWLWDKVVVFFTQVSICSHFGVMGVPVALLEHLAGLIASFAETWRDGSFTVPKSVPKSSSLNKMDLAHMLFCITAGTPGSCFGITSRVRNEWEVAKRGMWGHQTRAYPTEIHSLNDECFLSAFLTSLHLVESEESPGAGWCWTFLTYLPLLSSTSFVAESSMCASIWAVGSNCCTTVCVLFFTHKTLRKRMRETILWAVFHMIKNWAVSGLMADIRLGKSIEIILRFWMLHHTYSFVKG